jgi:hypothetical protein
MAKKKKEDFLDAANAEVLADMVSDPDTPDHLRVRMINKLLEARKSENFFATMMEERLSYGACPNCQHETHWLVPENDLNQMGFVSHELDDRVKRNTTAEECPRWQQACKKKKVTI